MKVTLLRHRRRLVIVIHLLLVVAAYSIAYLLRFDGTLAQEQIGPFFYGLVWLVALRALSFWAFRLYEGLWRYVSLWDLNNIILSVFVSSASFAVLVLYVLRLKPYPRSIIFIDAIVLICLLGGVRLIRRTYREFDRLHHEKRVLIYGAGDAGELLVRDVRNNRFYNWDPIGFIDDDPAKVGRFIHGFQVLGTRDALPRIMAEEQPHELVIAIVGAEPAAIRGIVKSLEGFKVPIKVLPSLRDVLEGRVSISQVRNLALEDLMARNPVDLDVEPVRQLINGRRVLVTGAGGSIGSELSRQIAQLGPTRLLLLDRYENALFDLCNDLDRLPAPCRYEPIIADIVDAAHMDRLFAEHRPEVVFHAAAHKHVPLMEANPAEAVKNNVRGTRVVAEAARRHGVTDFVLISSDKAVNPSSVMGATKRVAEHLVLSLRQAGGTRFVAVRFGNVLGSNGSVTRIFAQQIARGGPVLVTHPEIRRYFMLIPEAVQLVLHAAAGRDVGAVYTLDMGDQIRIVDLARNLIRLSGFIPDEEIEIQFIGLRPGEKMYEELAEADEALEPTDVPKVLRVRAPTFDLAWLRETIARLERAADEGNTPEVIATLGVLVPTFRATGVHPGHPDSHVLRFG